jgi:hypothetical protein
MRVFDKTTSFRQKIRQNIIWFKKIVLNASVVSNFTDKQFVTLEQQTLILPNMNPPHNQVSS